MIFWEKNIFGNFIVFLDFFENKVLIGCIWIWERDVCYGRWNVLICIFVW